MTNVEKLKEVISDEKFLLKVLQTNSTDEIKQLFHEKGLDLTDEQIDKIKKNFQAKLLELCNLDEGELKNITGGGAAKRMGYSVGESAAHDTALGITIGAGLGATTSLLKQACRVIGDGTEFSIRKFAHDALQGAIAGAGIGATVGAASGVSKGFENELKHLRKEDYKKS